MEYLILIAAAVIGLGIGIGIPSIGRLYRPPRLAKMLKAHFHPIPLTTLTISERVFPFRVRADLQRAVDRLFDGVVITQFCGVRKEYAHEGITLAFMLEDVVQTPPQFEDLDVGEELPVRCLKSGLWFAREGQLRYAVMLGHAVSYGQISGIRFEIATANDAAGIAFSQRFFKGLEDAVTRAQSYRGKILSLEKQDRYSGRSSGIAVHKLRTVHRDQVILPRKTLELLERNVIRFVGQREKLRAFKQATKKGLLFYGPPGTGKTHTIHYLTEALPGHTTLLIAAEQVALLDEYMVLARLLQPSIVVLEDVDLIARDRTTMDTPCEEALLNKLLNEMDGLREDADILFILTTNRPESLEQALASRPGRVDQAIEFPLPDSEGREKLVKLYSAGVEVPPDVVAMIVRRTDNVSAAFIKELMRRSIQFHLERNGTGQIESANIEQALEEMLFVGGSLNLTLLGASGTAATNDR